MAKSLKDKVAEALKEAVGEGARIELKDVAGEKVGGFVLSGTRPSRARRRGESAVNAGD